ncbi:MAG: low molecular weight protein-tyrosine-phosphatase [Pedobacter sp.]|nr:low molecular weight protein-tyrosine-phosphatase [Pedobacter sp.]MDQ8052729.1 low molecular weight protein-tyrosine-phosphatase [Pedobacter sp.]
MRILMVCLGNICRSPLAEGIMRKMVRDEGLDWDIASAGTGDWHVGRPPDARGIAVAETYGYDISAQRGRHFTADLFDQYDLILVMDKNNYRDVVKLAKTKADRTKVQFFLADEGEVIDPYLHSHLFDPVFREVEARCKRLINQYRTA